jgi:hypothetical protein
MTFLSPFAAVTAAAITVPLLLVLYLLKLRRRPVRVGSILFWPVAKEDVQANVPLKWLRPSWLLFLHLLILAAFALALGRPVITQGPQMASRVVVLLDTSASMSAVDEGQKVSRLELAKKKALEVVDRLRRAGGRHEVCLVAFASEARAVTSFTTSKSVIEDALGAVGPTDQPGSLAAALKLVDAISTGGQEESDSQEPPTAILLSDGAFRDRGKLPPSAMRMRFERIGPALERGARNAERGEGEAEPPPIDNLGIVGLSARRDAEDPGVVRIFVDVLNTNAIAVAAPVSLSIDGAVLERRAMEIPAASVLGPGRAATTFEMRNAEGGVVLASIARADALASDNAASVVLPPAQRPSIVLVEPDGAAGERSLTAAGWILEDALAELRARSFQSISASEYERRAAGGLMGVDLIVFDRVAPAKLPPVPTISFGAVPPGLAVSAGAEGGGTTVLFWLRAHPIMRNVALDAVVIAKTTELVMPSAAQVTELMRGRDGPLLVLVQEGAEGVGVRRIVAGFDLAMSNWPLQAGFPIFLADAVDYLTLRADAAAGRAFRTDEAVEVRVKPGSVGRVALKGPVNVVLREATAGPDSAAGGVLSAGVLARAGVYVVEGQSAVDRAVAVNVVDEVESSLASPEKVEVAGTALEGVAGAATPREVWEWFVLGGLALLVVEWFVYGRSVRT